MLADARRTGEVAMRVVVYAPADMRGREKHVQATAREVMDRGHEYAGEVHDPAAVRSILEAGLADLIAGRADHLVSLVEWALPIDPHGGRPVVPGVLGGAAALVIEKGEVWIAGLARVL